MPPPRLPDMPAAADDWAPLRRFTAARIALGHAGSGLPTAAHLAFQLAHARARDAVHTPLDTAALIAALTAGGYETMALESAARERATYLARPDLGRRLSENSQALLSQPMVAPDIVLAAVDGLSSTAVAANAMPVIAALTPRLEQRGRSLAPVMIATQGRVALGDHIGEILQAKVAVVLIGERPGLSAFDSLGIYITWMPRIGRVDAERNCISNVRAGGLGPLEAAAQAAELIEGMFRFATAGVELSSRLALPGS
jgi:ethanolamine ammonia-lyase small subunit